jgi:hypothetical protein
MLMESLSSTALIKSNPDSVGGTNRKSDRWSREQVSSSNRVDINNIVRSTIFPARDKKKPPGLPRWLFTYIID